MEKIKTDYKQIWKIAKLFNMRLNPDVAPLNLRPSIETRGHVVQHVNVPQDVSDSYITGLVKWQPKLFEKKNFSKRL